MRELNLWLASHETTAGPERRSGLWTTLFLDLSNNNGPDVNLRIVARRSRHTGITGVELKATEGTRFADPYFPKWRAEASAFGLRVMPYHFARPDEHPGEAGARAEAEHFCAVVRKLALAEWRPMLDFETAPFSDLWARAWCHRVRELLGVAPTFYSYTAAIETMRPDEPIGDGLVIAYPNGLPKVAPCPHPWKHWSAHQFSWSAVVDGVPGRADLNYSPRVRSLLAYPVRGAALEPVMRRRRRKA